MKINWFTGISNYQMMLKNSFNWNKNRYRQRNQLGCATCSLVESYHFCDVHCLKLSLYRQFLSLFFQENFVQTVARVLILDWCDWSMDEYYLHYNKIKWNTRLLRSCVLFVTILTDWLLVFHVKYNRYILVINWRGLQHVTLRKLRKY